MMSTATTTIEEFAGREDEHGFITDIETDSVPPGLNEDIVRLISAKKNEPEFMLEWRLKAYRHWVKLEKAEAEPKWANVHYPPIDYQDMIYYSAPKPKQKLNSMDEVDPEMRATFEKLGISLDEQKRMSGVAVDAIFDSMKQSLVAGDRIELRGFGVFTVKPRKTGIGRNPRTGAEVTIAPGKAVRFKPGKELHLLT